MSVTVPAYNVQDDIKKCLESFCIPGLDDDIEVLVVDDGSFDKTKEIAKKIANKHPKLFRYIRKENGGHGSAVNMGLSYATGKYFMIVDADDWISRKDFVSFVRQLRTCDADLTVSHYVRNHGLDSHRVNSGALEYKKKIPFASLEMAEYYFVLASICYRTRLLKEMHLKLPEGCYYDDLVYITEPMRFVSDVMFFDTAYYHYRVGHLTQSTAKKNLAANYKQHRAIVKRLFAYYKKYQADTAQMRYIAHVLEIACADHYYILLQCEPDVNLAKRRLFEMDRFLYKNHSQFYEASDHQIVCLHMLRKSKYRFLSIYRQLVKIKRKIQKEGG